MRERDEAMGERIIKELEDVGIGKGTDLRPYDLAVVEWFQTGEEKPSAIVRFGFRTMFGSVDWKYVTGSFDYLDIAKDLAHRLSGIVVECAEYPDGEKFIY